MTKHEFKALCHSEFIKRGFSKNKSSYYRSGIDGLLCKLSFQSSYGSAYYINCDYFMHPQAEGSLYSTPSDLMGRVFRVLSKDTIKGKPFMTALIDYNRYSPEELLPFISQSFDDYILPPLEAGRFLLLDGIENGTWHFAPGKKITDIEF